MVHKRSVNILCIVHNKFVDGSKKTSFSRGGTGKWENVDVRYIYFGRNSTGVMSSSIFEIGMPLDSGFRDYLKTTRRQLRTCRYLVEESRNLRAD